MNVVDIGAGVADAVQALSDMFADGWGMDYRRLLNSSASILYGESYTYTYSAQETSRMLDPENGAKDLFVIYDGNLDFFAWYPVPEATNMETDGKIFCFCYSAWQRYPSISVDNFRTTIKRRTDNSFDITLYNNDQSASYVSWNYNYVTMWTQKNPPVTNQSTRSLGGGYKNHPYIIHISCQLPPSKEVRLLANSIDMGAEIVEQVIVQTPFVVGTFTGSNSSSVTISAARGFENIIIVPVVNSGVPSISYKTNLFAVSISDYSSYFTYCYRDMTMMVPVLVFNESFTWNQNTGVASIYRNFNFYRRTTYFYIAWNNEG